MRTSTTSRRRVLRHGGEAQAETMQRLAALQRQASRTSEASSSTPMGIAIAGAIGGRAMEPMDLPRGVPMPDVAVEGVDLAGTILPTPEPGGATSTPGTTLAALEWDAATDTTGDVRETVQQLDPTTGYWSALPMASPPTPSGARALVQPERVAETIYIEAGGDAGDVRVVGLTATTSYTFRVVAVDELGACVGDPISLTTTAALAAGTLTLTSLGAGLYSASWTPATGGMAPISPQLIRQVGASQTTLATASPATVSLSGGDVVFVKYTDAAGTSVDSSSIPIAPDP